MFASLTNELRTLLSEDDIERNVPRLKRCNKEDGKKIILCGKKFFFLSLSLVWISFVAKRILFKSVGVTPLSSPANAEWETYEN